MKTVGEVLRELDDRIKLTKVEWEEVRKIAPDS
jgi:hypothetical protein